MINNIAETELDVKNLQEINNKVSYQIKYIKETEEEQSNFSEIELMTNINGEINYINMPFGNYLLNFLPIVNLKDLICANGTEQDLYMN